MCCVLQARIVEPVAIFSFKGSWPRDQTYLSGVSCISSTGRRILSQLGFVCPQPQPPLPPSPSKPEGGLLQNYRLEVSYGRIANYRPQGKNFQQGKSYQWHPSRGKRVYCISYKNWPPQQLSQWELVITLELWLFFPNQPSQPLTFLYNVLFLCWTSSWLFKNSLLVPNCNNSTIPK